MNTPIVLLPEPRSRVAHTGAFSLPDQSVILLDVPHPQTVTFSAARFQTALRSQFNLYWERAAGKGIPAGQIGLTIHLGAAVSHPQGYALTVSETGILLEGSDEAGIFYGICTLIQLVSQTGRSLPCLQILDWPDFPARGVMLDISRDKVPQLSTLMDLIDRLAGWKINQLQLYTENTFAYRNHPQAWAQSSPLTSDEILTLDAFCQQRFIELVPNQNSFGHMERWLKVERYAPLAETHGEITTSWGIVHGPSSLSPVHPGSLALIRSLYDELLPNFSSRRVNVGCDETFDLGQGQSKEAVAQKGMGRVYLDFLNAIYRDVSARGYQMLYWGDIVLDHPELVAELPRDAVGLLWGYEDTSPFDRSAACFARAGLPFYVCPGTSSWCSLAGRSANAIANLRSAAENGLKHGAQGYLITDWGDGGHWQMLPISYVGFVAGAAYSWCLAANHGLDLRRAVGRFAFDDRSETMGQLAFDLGNVYLNSGLILDNQTLFYRLLRDNLDKIPTRPEARPEILKRALSDIDAALQPLGRERMARPDADLIRREFQLTARLMRHAVYRGFLAIESDPATVIALSRQLREDIQQIITAYETIWLSRNRPGGLAHSLARFKTLEQEYAVRSSDAPLATDASPQDQTGPFSAL